MTKWLRIVLFLSVTTLGTFSPEPALADDWILLGNNSEMKVDVYYSSKKGMKGQMRHADLLFDYFEDNKDLGIAHRSEAELIKIDCHAKKFQLLNVTWYTQKMARGQIVYQTRNPNWIGLGSGTVYDEVANIVCASHQRSR